MVGYSLKITSPRKNEPAPQRDTSDVWVALEPYLLFEVYDPE